MNAPTRRRTRLPAVLALLFCLVASSTAWADPPAPAPPADEQPPAPAEPPSENTDDTAPARQTEHLQTVDQDTSDDADTQDHTARRAATYRAAGQKEKISRFRYIAGGLIGTFYGFGIGHAIVGEYSSSGWFYTISEAAAAGVLGYGIARTYGADYAPQGTAALLLGGSVAILLLRVAEIRDLWTRPEVARLERDTDTAFAVGPSVTDNSVGALLQWRW